MHSQLHFAAKRGDLETVKREIKRRPLRYDEPLDTKRSLMWQGMTPLMFAAQSPHATVQVLQLLLEKGANVNAVQSLEISGTVYSQSTPLMYAADCGDPDKVRLLIEHGAKVKWRNINHYSAVMRAVHGKGALRSEVIRVLLAANANPTITTTYNESPLKSAFLHFADFETIRLLLDAGADPLKTQWTQLWRSIAFGTLEDMQRELKMGKAFDLEETWELCLVVGDVEKAKLLTEYGATPGDHDLLPAVRKDNPEMVQWLLDYGVSTEAQDYKGATPLAYAASRGSNACLEVLIEHSAKVDAVDNFGKRAINLVSTAEGVRVLAKVGANLDYIDGDGYSLLRSAAEQGNVEVVRAALEMGANPNAVNPLLNQTALHMAVSHEEYEIAKLLLEAGADPNIVDLDDRFPPLLHVRSLETLKLLLDHGAKINDLGALLFYHEDLDLIAALKAAATN